MRAAAVGSNSAKSCHMPSSRSVKLAVRACRWRSWRASPSSPANLFWWSRIVLRNWSGVSVFAAASILVSSRGPFSEAVPMMRACSGVILLATSASRVASSFSSWVASFMVLRAWPFDIRRPSNKPSTVSPTRERRFFSATTWAISPDTRFCTRPKFRSRASSPAASRDVTSTAANTDASILSVSAPSVALSLVRGFNSMPTSLSTTVTVSIGVPRTRT